MLEVMFRQITVPIVEGRASDGDPHERTDHIHYSVRKLPLQLGRAEAERNQLHRGVDEVADKHSGGHNFRVGTFLLVQVPGATHAEEITPVARSVDDENHQVQCLRKKKMEE